MANEIYWTIWNADGDAPLKDSKLHYTIDDEKTLCGIPLTDDKDYMRDHDGWCKKCAKALEKLEG